MPRPPKNSTPPTSQPSTSANGTPRCDQVGDVRVPARRKQLDAAVKHQPDAEHEPEGSGAHSRTADRGGELARLAATR